MSEPRGPLYELKGVGKEFTGPVESLTILRKVDLCVERGDSVAILGASGSGKSTLLHILGALDTASWGETLYQGQSLARLPAGKRARLRNREIGFVFQFHHLLPEFSTLENVAMPGLIARRPRAEVMDKARDALALVGMEHRMDFKVTTLSGGERQRAAIARAIIARPLALLADEPTGNLDEASGAMIGRLLLDLNKSMGMTLIVVTHNQDLARMMDRRLELTSGELYAFEN